MGSKNATFAIHQHRGAIRCCGGYRCTWQIAWSWYPSPWCSVSYPHWTCCIQTRLERTGGVRWLKVLMQRRRCGACWTYLARSSSPTSSAMCPMASPSSLGASPRFCARRFLWKSASPRGSEPLSLFCGTAVAFRWVGVQVSGLRTSLVFSTRYVVMVALTLKRFFGT